MRRGCAAFAAAGRLVEQVQGRSAGLLEVESGIQPDATSVFM
jgi:hypothetical protein